MARYRINGDYATVVVEADSLNRDEGYLILLRAGEAVAVFARWEYVVIDSDDD